LSSGKTHPECDESEKGKIGRHFCGENDPGGGQSKTEGGRALLNQKKAHDCRSRGTSGGRMRSPEVWGKRE